MKNNIIILKVIAIIIIPFLFSCSKELSRDEAEKAIKLKENLPTNENQDFQFTQTEEVNSIIPFNYLAVGQNAYYDEDLKFTKRKEAAQKAKLDNISKLPIFETLEKEGLITYSIEILDMKVARADGDISSPGNLSARGINAFGGEFGDFKCTRTVSHIGKLTETAKKYITSDNKVIVATDEFGEITGIVERKELNGAEVNYTLKRTNITPFGRILFNLTETTFNRTATFTKFDDGWRINSTN